MLLKRITTKLEERKGKHRTNFLDRRRLEEAFLLYASLEVIQRHNLWKEIATLPCDRNEMIEHVTKHYSHAFSNKWEDHTCEAPGCRTVLVLDGNMKNARQVCMVKDIGELHFSNMIGSILIGCQNTPAKGLQILHIALQYSNGLS